MFAVFEQISKEEYDGHVQFPEEQVGGSNGIVSLAALYKPFKKACFIEVSGIANFC